MVEIKGFDKAYNGQIAETVFLHRQDRSATCFLTRASQ